MTSVRQQGVPKDFGERIKGIRDSRKLTQTQFAELLGVSFASVNRWENGQNRPHPLAWQRVLDLASQTASVPAANGLVFDAGPDAVAAVAEAHRLDYGHLVNRAFAAETSLVDALPHQRIAVYSRMLDQSPLRFLLADDAGAGKTIMTGLYVREMRSRRVIRRVLVVPPAGLVGNWEREMRTLFRLPFKIVGGADAQAGNPFAGPDSDLVIASVDSLRGESLFRRLQQSGTPPYDLVVFDEAHKLSADQASSRVRKTNRYKLAEALAGCEPESARWALGWSATHVLLLTATPHMGKDHPYYFLWRLLLPQALSTYSAFEQLDHKARSRHFIRRTKEEMLRWDGTPLYPKRTCITHGYELSEGEGSEQELYDLTTDYIEHYYNQASTLNRSAAQLAMSVFQRRLASSTFALLRSMERREEKLAQMIDDIEQGRYEYEDLLATRDSLGQLEDPFEQHTADEAAAESDALDSFEDEALSGVVATDLSELRTERRQVSALVAKARQLRRAGRESKFEKLLEVLQADQYAGEKLIVFTEHRDTATFLVERLEAIGYTGQVAQIHGGLPYQERERQMEFFRAPLEEGGANYLVATDAAGEGINLQFCWLMVNYDIPWNPARLEQRMGRIHRYGQQHDPVVIANLVAHSTREGRVVETLLTKLDAIRQQLDSDKVFDVVGRLLREKSLLQYMEDACQGKVEEAVRDLAGRLDEAEVRKLAQQEQSLFGDGGDVKRELPALAQEAEREIHRLLLPGHVQCFVEKTLPLLGLSLQGDLGGTFRLSAANAPMRDALFRALDTYPEEAQGRLTFRKPTGQHPPIWLHPGEPVFDAIASEVKRRYAADALRGAVFVDPKASEPYLFHLGLVTVERLNAPNASQDLLGEDVDDTRKTTTIVESRLVGLKQPRSGPVTPCPVESLLLMPGLPNAAPGAVPLAGLAPGKLPDAEAYLREQAGGAMLAEHRARAQSEAPARVASYTLSHEHLAAALVAERTKIRKRLTSGEADAEDELRDIKEEQERIKADHKRLLEDVRGEADRLHVGEARFLAHVLVVPSEDPALIEQYDANTEAVAMDFAIACEESAGAVVHDVSDVERARAADLLDWPGFDLLSQRPDGQERDIEVKGRRGVGEIHLTENEWSKAGTLQDKYWLYVVYDCATSAPRLTCIHNPHKELFAKTKGAVFSSADILAAATPDQPGPVGEPH